MEAQDTDSRSTPYAPRFGQFVPGRSRPLMAMIEVTNRCNMHCSICFSDANHPPHDISLAQVRQRLEELLLVTQTPIPIQISGGEPTMRKELLEIISMARSLGYDRIELITNGIRISQDPTLLMELKQRGLTSVYLQFDGLKRRSSLEIRGRYMRDVRYRAVEVMRQVGLCCTLAMAVTQGVNEKEIGEVVHFGIQNIDTVRAINFQSATRFPGRFQVSGHNGGYDLPELLNIIERETGVPADTFRSEHMGHPSCNAMSYLFLVNGKIEPLFKYISGDDILAFLGSRRREKVLDLFQGKKAFFLRHFTDAAARNLIRKAAPIFGYNPFNVLRTESILLFAKAFMEREDLDEKRVRECCYGISTSEGVFSFCAYNNLYRFHRDVAGQGRVEAKVE